MVYKLSGKNIMVGVLSLSLLSTNLPSVSHAGMIGTQTLLATEQSGDTLDRIEVILSRQQVRDQMITLGVDPAEVRERLAALTEDELHMLEENLNTLPAGGLLAVIGVVFVVLIILEVVGVTDIFTKV